MSAIVEWVTHADNFLLLQKNGAFVTNSDVVAKCRLSSGEEARLVVSAGAVVKRPKPGRTRANVLLSLIRRLACSRKEQDDIYLELMRKDGAKDLAITKLLLRAAGYIKQPRGYAKAPNEKRPAVKLDPEHVLRYALLSFVAFVIFLAFVLHSEAAAAGIASLVALFGVIICNIASICPV